MYVEVEDKGEVHTKPTQTTSTQTVCGSRQENSQIHYWKEQDEKWNQSKDTTKVLMLKLEKRRRSTDSVCRQEREIPRNHIAFAKEMQIRTNLGKRGGNLAGKAEQGNLQIVTNTKVPESNKVKEWRTKGKQELAITPRQHHDGVNLAKGCDIKACLNSTGIERQPGPAQEDAPLTIPGHALPTEISTYFKRQTMDHKHVCPSNEDQRPPIAPGKRKPWTNGKANAEGEENVKTPEWPPGGRLKVHHATSTTDTTMLQNHTITEGDDTV